MDVIKKGSIPSAQAVGQATTEAQLSDLESKARDKLYNVHEAKAILENPFFNAVWDQLEEEILEQWGSTTIDQVEIRERAHVAMGMFKALRERLEEFTSGEIAATEAVERILRKRKLMSEKH